MRTLGRSQWLAKYGLARLPYEFLATEEKKGATSVSASQTCTLRKSVLHSPGLHS